MFKKRLDDLDIVGEAAIQDLHAIVEQRLQMSRTEAGKRLTQAELASRLGVEKQQVSRWLRKPSNMTIQSAAKMLHAMGRMLVLVDDDPMEPLWSRRVVAEPVPPTGVAAVVNAVIAGGLAAGEAERLQKPPSMAPSPRRRSLALEAFAGKEGAGEDESSSARPARLRKLGRLEASAGEIVEVFHGGDDVLVKLPRDVTATCLEMAGRTHPLVWLGGGEHLLDGVSRVEAEQLIALRQPVLWR